MINNEGNEKSKDTKENKDGIIDVVNTDIQCHLVIKDKDTNEILINQRG